LTGKPSEHIYAPDQGLKSPSQVLVDLGPERKYAPVAYQSNPYPQDRKGRQFEICSPRTARNPAKAGLQAGLCSALLPRQYLSCFHLRHCPLRLPQEPDAHFSQRMEAKAIRAAHGLDDYFTGLDGARSARTLLLLLSYGSLRHILKCRYVHRGPCKEIVPRTVLYLVFVWRLLRLITHENDEFTRKTGHI